MTDSGDVCVSYPKAGVGLISLSSSGRLNTLTLATKKKICDAIAKLSTDDAIFSIVLTGDEKSFIAGTDLAEMADMQPSDHDQLRTNEMFNVIRSCEKPIIAAVEGYALGGGCETALACDVVFAGKSARFGQPEIRVGIMPGAGGTQYLVRSAGKLRAMKWLLSGNQFSSEEALALGIISEISNDGEALERAISFAELIVKMPPFSIRAIKKAVLQAFEAPLSEALKLEREYFVSLFATNDQVEGMRAFLEKRNPHFTGT